MTASDRSGKLQGEGRKVGSRPVSSIASRPSEGRLTERTPVVRPSCDADKPTVFLWHRLRPNLGVTATPVDCKIIRTGREPEEWWLIRVRLPASIGQPPLKEQVT